MVDVVTHRYDNGRAGVNLLEHELTTANVNAREFGKLFTRKVDGDVYAQPLIVSDVVIDGAPPCSVVYVATSNNSLYAFDAEHPLCSDPIWHLTQKQLGAPVPRGKVGGDRYRDFAATIGITSTPVVDRESNTIYFEVKSRWKDSYFHHVHACDLRTGQMKVGSPREIAAAVKNAKGETVKFEAQDNLNRPALLLMNGILYLAFGSHADHHSEDIPSYHGWVLAYRAADLEPFGAFCATPDGGAGGIWQSGAGLSGDGENVYCVVGNGTGESGQGNLGNSIVKLHLDEGRKQLNVVAWFTPDNVQYLNANDLDLSTGGVVLRKRNMLLAGDKAGTCYVLSPREDGTRLPHRLAFPASTYTPFGDQAPESADPHSHIHGTPVLWEGRECLMLYVWGEHDYLRAYSWSGVQFDSFGRSPMHVPVGMPGGILSLSANAEQDGSAIVWAAHPYTEDANQATVDGILRAFDARDLLVELWNSQQRPQHDRLGKFAKFCPPVVANGRVYMGTFADPYDRDAPAQLVVYGVLRQAREAALPGWLQADVGTPIVGNAKLDRGRLIVTGSGRDIETTTDEFHYVYRRWSGDGSISARVASLQNTDPWAKAGVMIRHNLDTASAHAMTVLTPTNGAEFQWRRLDGSMQSHFDPVPASAPYWVRVERRADRLCGYVSADGVAWTSVGEQTFNFWSQVLIGLAVTCHHAQTSDLCTNTAVFDHVVIEP